MPAASDFIPPVVAGVAAILGGMWGSAFELRKVRAQRFSERERSFEKAQGGYRACYRKFLINVAAFHAKAPGHEGKNVTLAILLDNFWEAGFTGDPAVLQELESYWDAETRANGDPPPKKPPSQLIQAMLEHGSRSLEEHIRLKRAAEKKRGRSVPA